MSESKVIKIKPGESVTIVCDEKEAVQTTPTPPNSGGEATATDKPDGVTEDEWQGFVQLKKALGDYNIAHPDLADAPFLDAEELSDPELHRRREILRQRYNFNKSRNRPTPPTTDIEGVKSVGEILKDHPLIQKLINNEVRDSATD